MKLQTMLLPTGEFVLIASTPNLPHEDSVGSLEHFREAAGAVAFLIINEDVEVENALVDADAVRVDFWSELDDDEDPDGGPDGDDGEREGLASVTYLPNASVTFETDLSDPTLQKVIFGAVANESAGWETIGTTDAGDQLLLRRLEEGAEFSPAGLVKGGPGVDTMPELHHPPAVANGLLAGEYIEAGFTIQSPTADLLALSRYFVTDGEGETEALAAMARLANPTSDEWWAGPACPCWPNGAAGRNGVARCVGCPEAKYDAPDPTAV